MNTRTISLFLLFMFALRQIIKVFFCFFFLYVLYYPAPLFFQCFFWIAFFFSLINNVWTIRPFSNNVEYYNPLEWAVLKIPLPGM